MFLYSLRAPAIQKKGVLDEGAKELVEKFKARCPLYSTVAAPHVYVGILAPKLRELPIRTLSMSVLRGHVQVCEEQLSCSD